MPASDQGAGGEPPGNADSQGGHGRPDGAREGDAATGQTPQAAVAPGTPGLDEEAGPSASVPSGWVPQSVLTMPFPTCVEAELARQSLESSAYPLGGAVQQEVTVLGNLLAIQLTAEDPGLLRTAISSCLNQLSLLLQILQRFVPVFFVHPSPGKAT